MTQDLTVLQGSNTFAFVRPLSEAGTSKGLLVPYQTNANFEISRSSKSKETKSGSIPTLASPQTDLEIDFLDSTDPTSAKIYDSILNASTLEIWLVKTDYVKDGKYFSWYMRGMPQKDASDNDADGQSARKVKFSIQGEPQRGWTALPEEAQEEINYVYRGLDTVSAPKNDGTDGGGKAWSSADEASK